MAGAESQLMAHIEDRRSQGPGWRVRYRDPSGQERSKSFKRKAEAERFLIGNEAARLAGVGAGNLSTTGEN